MSKEIIDLRNGYSIDRLDMVESGYMVTLTVLKDKTPIERLFKPLCAFLVVAASFLVCAAIFAQAARAAADGGKTANSSADTDISTVETLADVSGDYLDPLEDVKIEAALVEQGYFRDDVPLTYGEQDALHTAADEFGVDYCLMLGLIERETNFRNIPGDGGNAYGYCQVWPKWWSGLMDEIGVEDLNDPGDNFRTACAIVAHLTEKHGTTERALTAYNSGKPGQSAYASAVLANAENWRAGAWR